MFINLETLIKDCRNILEVLVHSSTLYLVVFVHLGIIHISTNQISAENAESFYKEDSYIYIFYFIDYNCILIMKIKKRLYM